MTVNVTGALKEGYRRSVQRNGLALIGILFVLYAISGLVGVGIAQWAASQQFVPVDTRTDPALFVPPAIAGLLSLIAGIGSLIVSIAAIRVFVSDETERLPREYFTRNMVWAALNFVVGAVVFGIVVALGFVALFVPGVFLLVTLVFWGIYVAVEDENFLDAFRSSWVLTRGHRLDLLLLGIAMLLITAIIGAVFGLGDLAGGPVAVLLAQAGSAITTVFSTAVLATAYTDLTARTEEEELVSTDDGPTAPADDITGGTGMHETRTDRDPRTDRG